MRYGCPAGELAEETGIGASERDLVPFGCLSEAEAHTIHYANGDVTHCFALCFRATSWSGEPTPNEEAVEVGFFDPQAPPQPLHSLTSHALRLLDAFHDQGAFQVR